MKRPEIKNGKLRHRWRWRDILHVSEWVDVSYGLNIPRSTFTIRSGRGRVIQVDRDGHLPAALLRSIRDGAAYMREATT